MPKVSITVSGCLLAAVALNGHDAAAQTPVAATVREAAIVRVVPRCPSKLNYWTNPQSQESAAVLLQPIIGAVAEAGIQKGVSFANDWLKRFAAELSATTTAHDVGTMYVLYDGKLAARNGCVVLFRGQVGSDAEFDKRVRAKTIGNDAVWTVERLRILRDGAKNELADDEMEVRRGRIAVVETPLVYGEFEIRYNSAKSATSFTLRPIYLDYRSTAAERPGAGKKDLLFTIVFDQTTSGPTPAVFARFDLAIPRTPIGARYGAELLADLVGRPQPLPSPGKRDGEQKASDLVPMNVSVTMLETEKAGDLERFVGEALDENKDNIGSAISNHVLEAFMPREKPRSEIAK
jgi:hypothetical protein